MTGAYAMPFARTFLQASPEEAHEAWISGRSLHLTEDWLDDGFSSGVSLPPFLGRDTVPHLIDGRQSRQFLRSQRRSRVVWRPASFPIGRDQDLNVLGVQRQYVFGTEVASVRHYTARTEAGLLKDLAPPGERYERRLPPAGTEHRRR